MLAADPREALKFIEFQHGKIFQFHSLRVKYEPSEATMTIDVATICSLELIQNVQNSKSKLCLYGLLNETLTPMGGRLLRSNILQPSTNVRTITKRYDAVEELTTKEEMFFAVRRVLRPFLDAEKLLSSLIILEVRAPMALVEASINKVIALKHFIQSIRPVCDALAGARSEILVGVQANCASEQLDELLGLINETINEDTQYSKSPLELRNQRTYAVKSGVHGLLDVARTAYKELTEDAYHMVEELREAHNFPFELKFDTQRQFYIKVSADELENRQLPPSFTNVFKTRNMVECQVLDLMKLNQKITICHEEILTMSDKAIQELVSEIRTRMSILFKCCESIAILDMLVAFAHVGTANSYIRPQLTDTLAIQAGRHPVREAFHKQKYIPNDVFATQQSRFQIITGCNMSGKSTYIRSIALLTVMAQIGSFVPASYASFPIMHQLFARVNMDDSIEANVSTFAAEMRETAFILKNISRRSIAIVDELGRGTSTRDGLAIALAIAEALVNSRALVWFVTHFRDLASIMSERTGVVNMHLAVEMGGEVGNENITMLYKIAEGPVQEQHYGLKLARVVPLPSKVLEVAEQVAEKLERRSRKKKKTSIAVSREKKRKLILNLKEHLTQTKNGVMEGEVLADWLRQLQREFIIRMTTIDAEAEEAAKVISDDDDDDGDDEEEVIE
jgi:DNA mismatch repair protein MSH4